MTHHRLGYAGGPTAPAFPTRNGTRQHPDNIRARIIEPIRERVNELLAAEGRLPIAHMTPHTLRRTFASILAACDVPPRRAMYLMGHTDAKFTLGVYQTVLDMGPGSVDALQRSSAARSPRLARSTSATAFSHRFPPGNENGLRRRVGLDREA